MPKVRVSVKSYCEFASEVPKCDMSVEESLQCNNVDKGHFSHKTY